MREYLENISHEALSDYQNLIRDYVRGRFGLYALYDGDSLYYVGLASELNHRLKRHLSDKHGRKWDRFSIYLTISDGHLKELESLFLRIGKPLGNSQKGKFANAKNLNREFDRDIGLWQRSVRDRLMGRNRKAKRRSTANARKQLRKRDSDQKSKAVRLPPLSGLLRRGRLRATYKAVTYTANVRSSGRIRYKGKLYNSPSEAAEAICGRAVNGWYFWRFQSRPGQWERLQSLRK